MKKTTKSIITRETTIILTPEEVNVALLKAARLSKSTEFSISFEADGSAVVSAIQNVTRDKSADSEDAEIEAAADQE